MDTVLETLEAIHAYRLKKQRLEAEVEERQAQLRAHPLQAEIDWRKADIKTIEANLEQLRGEVTEEALVYYRTYSNKHPFPGVDIRVTRELTYDATTARDWCWANLPSALALDTKTFANMILQLEKSNPMAVPGFIKIGDKPSVTLATDLAKHLPGSLPINEP